MQDNTIYDIELTDITGRNVITIRNIDSEKYIISGENLEVGVYMYRIISDKGLDLRGKIVVE